MLVFGDAITEARYLSDLRNAVQKEVGKKGEARSAHVILKAVLKKHGRFAPMKDVVEYTIEKELKQKNAAVA